MKWHRKRFWRSQREFGIEKNENLWRLLRGPLWHLSCTAASFISICVKEYSAQRVGTPALVEYLYLERRDHCWYCCIVDKVVLEKCLLIDIVVMSAFPKVYGWDGAWMEKVIAL
jgi:hypothetical protein